MPRTRGVERFVGPECPKCHGCYTHKHRKTSAGTQQYYCNDCGRTFVLNPIPQSQRPTGHPPYICISPEGKEYLTPNLAQFCREHKLDHSAMSRVSRGRASSYKGWQCAVKLLSVG